MRPQRPLRGTPPRHTSPLSSPSPRPAHAIPSLQPVLPTTLEVPRPGSVSTGCRTGTRSGGPRIDDGADKSYVHSSVPISVVRSAIPNRRAARPSRGTGAIPRFTTVATPPLSRGASVGTSATSPSPSSIPAHRAAARVADISPRPCDALSRQKRSRIGLPHSRRGPTSDKTGPLTDTSSPLVAHSAPETPPQAAQKSTALLPACAPGAAVPTAQAAITDTGAASSSGGGGVPVPVGASGGEIIPASVVDGGIASRSNETGTSTLPVAAPKPHTSPHRRIGRRRRRLPRGATHSPRSWAAGPWRRTARGWVPVRATAPKASAAIVRRRLKAFRRACGGLPEEATGAPSPVGRNVRRAHANKAAESNRSVGDGARDSRSRGRP